MPLMQDRSLDLFTSSPACCHCATDASQESEEGDKGNECDVGNERDDGNENDEGNARWGRLRCWIVPVKHGRKPE